MPQRPNARVPIGYDFDPRGGQQFIQQNKQLQQQLGNLQGEMAKQNVTAAEYARRTLEIIEAQERNARQLREIEARTNTVNAANRQAAALIRQQVDAIETRNAVNREALELLRADTQAAKENLRARSLTIGSRLATAEQIRAGRESGGFLGDLRTDAFGGGLPQTGGGGGSTRRRTLGALGTFGTSIRNLPDVGPSTEIANVLIGFDRITAILGVTSAAATAAAGVLGVVALGFVAIHNALEPGRRETRNFIKAVEDYTEAVVLGTRKVAQAELQRLQDEILVEQARGEFIRNRLANQRREFAQEFGAEEGQVDVAQFFNISGLGELASAADASSQKVSDLEDQLGFLNQTLGESRISLGDTREFLEVIFSIPEQAREARIASLASEFQFRQQVAQLRESASREDLNRIRENNRIEFTLNRERLRQLELLGSTSTVVAEEIDSLNKRQAELTLQAQLLTAELEPVIALREQEAAALAALSKEKEVLLQQYQQEAERVQAIKDLQIGADQARAKILELEKTRDDRISEIRDQLLEREAQAEQEAGRAQAENDRRTADARLKLFEDNYKRILDIERRFTRSFTQAIGERDALAAYNAKIAREDELRAQREAVEEREKEIETSYRRENDIIQQRRREVLQQATDAARKARDIEFQKAQAQIDILKQSAQKQIQAALALATQSNAILESGFKAATMKFENFVKGLAGGIPAGGGGQGYNPAPTPKPPETVVNVPLPGGGSQPGYAVPVNPIYPGQPGYVVQYSPQITGQTRRQVEQQMFRMQGDFLDQLYGRTR